MQSVYFPVLISAPPRPPLNHPPATKQPSALVTNVVTSPTTVETHLTAEDADGGVTNAITLPTLVVCSYISYTRQSCFAVAKFRCHNIINTIFQSVVITITTITEATMIPLLLHPHPLEAIMVDLTEDLDTTEDLVITDHQQAELLETEPQTEETVPKMMTADLVFA